MSLFGNASPKINSIILPSDRTFVKTKTTALYDDNKSINGDIYRVFNNDNDGNLLYSVIYNIKLENISISDYIELKKLDGQKVEFYPHSDSTLSYESYMNILEYNKNEKYRIYSINIDISVIQYIIKDLTPILGKVVNSDVYSDSMNMYTSFYSNKWTEPILSFTDKYLSLESVIKNSKTSVYFCAVWGFSSLRRVSLVKVDINGSIIEAQSLDPSTQTAEQTVLVLNNNETKIYLFRYNYGTNWIFEYDSSTLLQLNVINGSNNSYYHCNGLTISSDDEYLWTNSGSNGRSITRIKISDSSIIVRNSSFNSLSCFLSTDGTFWRADSGIDGKISKSIETNGVIFETIYDNNDMKYIKHITVDNNGHIICLQRDDIGNSKLFKVNPNGGQTLYSYDFGALKFIYNISIDGNNNYYLDYVDTGVKEVLKINASKNDFNIPYSIGNQANAYDNCNYTGYKGYSFPIESLITNISVLTTWWSNSMNLEVSNDGTNWIIITEITSPGAVKQWLDYDLGGSFKYVRIIRYSYSNPSDIYEVQYFKDTNIDITDQLTIYPHNTVNDIELATDGDEDTYANFRSPSGIVARYGDI